jgi:hypothetical protein
MYNEYFGYNIGFFITGKNRVGFDIYNTLSGLEDVNIVMEGYYN